GTLAHQRNDAPYLPDGTVAFHSNATLPPGTITREHEKHEYQLWLQKLKKNSIQVGPTPPTGCPDRQEIYVNEPEVPSDTTARHAAPPDL
ncbi:hypothetical protein SAMN04487941_0119, partial [Pontibacter akesuensis]